MSKINRFIVKALEWVLAVLLGISVLFILAQVIFRYILHSPLDWTEQTSRYMFIWMMMLGAAVMFYRDGAMAFDLLHERLPPRVKFWVEALIKLSIIAFSVYYGYQAFLLASKVVGRSTSGVRVPLTFMYSSMGISNVLIISVMLEKIVDHFRPKREIQGKEVDNGNI